MSLLLFFAVLFILVLVHEWGHFIVAKKTGMRVDEFGIGFPPKLFGIKKGETEYTFNALPIGGFVKIWGENYDDADEAADKSRAFSSRPKWAQALVLIAGVTMNVIFAWFLFTTTYLIGIPAVVDEAVATDAAKLYVSGILPDSPATSLPVGAVINSISFGDTIYNKPTPSEFSSAVTAAAPGAVQISYTYNDETKQIDLTPKQNLTTDKPERYVVGASLSLLEVQKRPLITAIIDGAQATWNGLIGISLGLWTLVSQAFVGEADFSQVAGPVGIVGMVGDAAAFGITALLTFTAIISLNLAVINLLPFPALDGGRLVFVAIEAVTGKQIPPEWAGRVNLIGFAILMLLMITVTYNDIIRLL
jgi:regulator of sigma E protease